VILLLPWPFSPAPTRPNLVGPGRNGNAPDLFRQPSRYVATSRRSVRELSRDGQPAVNEVAGRARGCHKNG
jgi:hypothetical protein